jgi:hypothetical protein
MIHTVIELSRAWREAGVNFSVANGHDSFPDTLGRDIDFVVEPSQIKLAVERTVAVMEQEGWKVVVRTRAELVQCIGIRPEDSKSLIIDHFPGMRWGPAWLVESPRPVETSGPFPLDPWVTFVKRVLLHVLTSPAPKFSRHPDRLELSEGERSAAADRLPSLVGADLAIRLLNAVSGRDVQALQELTPLLRRALTVTSFRRTPARALHASVQWATTRLTLAADRPLAPIVAIVGPDGVGKTSVLKELAHQAKERIGCHAVHIRHWRPGVLPPLGGLAGKTIPTGSAPPRRKTGRFGSLRTMYYALDYLFGYYLRDRRESADFQLLLYDRCALDMCVDPVRFGIRSGKLMRRLWPMLPKPNLVVLLTDEPARIRARKAELTEAEIAEQLRTWMEFADRGQVHLVLQVDRSPAQLAEAITDQIIDRFLVMNSNFVRGSEPQERVARELSTP